MREYIHSIPRKHYPAIERYFDLMENSHDIDPDTASGRKNRQKIKSEITNLLQGIPSFFEPPLMLIDMLREEGKMDEADKLLSTSFDRVMSAISNKNGELPDLLVWGLVENRSIMRIIVQQGIVFWEANWKARAKALFQEILRMDLEDRLGVRFYILAILEHMSHDDFEFTFIDSNGFYKESLTPWFEKGLANYPEYFKDWSEKMKEYE